MELPILYPTWPHTHVLIGGVVGGHSTMSEHQHSNNQHHYDMLYEEVGFKFEDE